MKIEDAIKNLDSSIGKSGNKAEDKFRQQFSNILHELSYKNLTPSKLQKLEKELDFLFLDLDPSEPEAQKQLEVNLKLFLKMLRKECSLLPEGHFTSYGMKIGILGGAFVLLILVAYVDSQWKFYVPLAGLLTGMLIGSFFDRQIKKQGRTLLTKMY